MKITIEVKDGQFDVFLAFIKTLDYVTVSSEMYIPQWQIDEVNERMVELEKNPEKAIDFDKAISDIEKKYGL